MTSILAIYRGKLDENRGTPIRVRSLLERLAKNGQFSLTVASWDEALPFPASHIRLTNRKSDDLRAIARTVREQNVRIVMGHTMATWYYLFILKVICGVRTALEMHGFIEEEAYYYGSIGRLTYFFQHAVYRLFYGTCDLITTCSETATRIIARDNPNTMTIFGGVDTDMFRLDVPPLASVHSESGTTLIGYAGNLRKWQGVPFLLDAFKTLHAEDSSFRLAVLSSEAKNIPAGAGIETYEQVPHEAVPAFLAACDVLVIPRMKDAVSEISFASKLPEYMAMGKPVVASRTSDAQKIITDGKDGLLYEPGDQAGFMDALRRLSDPALRARIGGAARETSLRFRWDMQAAILAKALQTLL